MTELYATVLFLFVLFFLLGSSVWVGLALVGVAWVGMELFTSRPAGDAMITTIWTGASSWTLTALPLFIWMGEILYRTRLSEDIRFLPDEPARVACLYQIAGLHLPQFRSFGHPYHSWENVYPQSGVAI